MGVLSWLLLSNATHVHKLKRGLTLGKCAPLHRGHQMVIETGLSEMDEMVIIIYDVPETT